MNGPNGFAPNNYGAPPPMPNPYGVPASQPPAAYGPPPQQAYGTPSPYGAAPAPAFGAQPQYPQPVPMMNPAVPQKNPGLAVALELLGGFFFQTFGIGHLYAGNIGVGLGLMFGYWVLTAINVALCFVFVGLITWPLTWLAFMILASITANSAAKKANAKAAGLPF
jgi:hypothetical protein